MSKTDLSIDLARPTVLWNATRRTFFSRTSTAFQSSCLPTPLRIHNYPTTTAVGHRLWYTLSASPGNRSTQGTNLGMFTQILLQESVIDAAWVFQVAHWPTQGKQVGSPRTMAGPGRSNFFVTPTRAAMGFFTKESHLKEITSFQGCVGQAVHCFDILP